MTRHSVALVFLVAICTCIGDADKNGFVNSSDFVSVRAHYGQPADPMTGEGDADCNGFVNSSDFAAVQDNFGRACDWSRSATGDTSLPTPALPSCDSVTPIPGQLVRCASCPPMTGIPAPMPTKTPSDP